MSFCPCFLTFLNLTKTWLWNWPNKLQFVQLYSSVIDKHHVKSSGLTILNLFTNMKNKSTQSITHTFQSIVE